MSHHASKALCSFFRGPFKSYSIANAAVAKGEKSIWEAEVIAVGKKKPSSTDMIPPLTVDAHFAMDLVPSVIKIQTAREDRLEGYKSRAMEAKAKQLRLKSPAPLFHLTSQPSSHHSPLPVRPTRIALEVEKVIYSLFEQDALPHSTVFLDCWRIEAIRLDKGLSECHIAWSADPESAYFTSLEDLSAKLERLRKQVRYLLAQKLALKRVPELSFHIYDDATMHSRPLTSSLEMKHLDNLDEGSTTETAQVDG